MQVDPDMDISRSESSDFEDVYQVREDVDNEAEDGDKGAAAAKKGGAQEDPERAENLAALREMQGAATVIQTANTGGGSGG